MPAAEHVLRGRPFSVRDLTGERFGQMTVTSRAANKWGSAAWNCLCDCGRTAVVSGGELTRKVRPRQSCGCLKLGRRPKHGDIGSAEYRAWTSMLTRCFNPKMPAYHNYGGRGITVDAEWRRSYEAFLAYMGRRPSPQHSLDRYPNNDGNYEPGNCRWATPGEQRQNSRPVLRRKS